MAEKNPGDKSREADMANRFNYHRPDEETAYRHQEIRDAFSIVAFDILRFSPPGREQALAFTNLEQAMFWTNAAIARLTTEGVRR